MDPSLKILHQASDWVAVDKPPGLFVHPPEDGRGKDARARTAMHIIRDQIGQKVFPVHRLDKPTSGILLFALTSERAAWFQRQFQSQAIKKSYAAVVRGWCGTSGKPFECDEPLNDYRTESASSVEAKTTITPFARGEIPVPYGKHASIRLTFLGAEPHTGRFHQIRRHLGHMAHPIVGDTTHGDLRFNRIILAEKKWDGLCLRAVGITIPNETENEKSHRIEAPWPIEWEPILSFFELPLNYKISES